MHRARRRTKRLCSGVLAGAALFVVGTSMSASAAPSSVTPIVVCSVTRHGSTHTLFGYDNTGAALSLGVGSSNHFSPGPADRGQPTTFGTGTKINVFAIDAPGPVTWTLDGVGVRTPGQPCQTTPASSSLASWGPVVALVSVTLLLGGLLFWRTRRLRART
jgi:hypothetical protein